MINFKRKTKQVCANCHFLKLYGGTEGSVEKNPDDKERKSIRKGDFDSVTKYVDKMELVFECHRGVWSEGYKISRDKDTRQKRINETSRKDFCFFLKYKPGMLYPAAEELQKRDYETDRFKKNRRLAIIALWISGIALVVSIVFSIISILKKCAPGT